MFAAAASLRADFNYVFFKESGDRKAFRDEIIHIIRSAQKEFPYSIVGKCLLVPNGSFSTSALVLVVYNAAAFDKDRDRALSLYLLARKYTQDYNETLDFIGYNLSEFERLKTERYGEEDDGESSGYSSILPCV